MAILTTFTLPGLAWCLATSTVVLIIVATLTRRLLLTPLNGVPGPMWASVSAVWLWIHDLQGTAPGVIKELHEKYGTIHIEETDLHNPSSRF
jgi:hypothetical protein